MTNEKGDLEGSIASALGRMVMRFAALEMMIRFTLHQVLDEMDEDEVMALTSELSFRKTRAVLMAVFAQRNPDSNYLVLLREFMKRADQLEARRNALVHSAWVYSDLPQAMLREKIKVTDKGKFRVDSERFSGLEELNRFVDQIDELSADIAHSWREEYLGVRVIREGD